MYLSTHRALSRHTPQVCCARFNDGREECDKKYCAIHARKGFHKRAARVTRRMHETGHPTAQNLEIGAHIGMDILDASLHHDEVLNHF